MEYILTLNYKITVIYCTICTSLILFDLLFIRFEYKFIELLYKILFF